MIFNVLSKPWMQYYIYIYIENVKTWKNVLENHSSRLPRWMRLTITLREVDVNTKICFFLQILEGIILASTEILLCPSFPILSSWDCSCCLGNLFPFTSLVLDLDMHDYIQLLELVDFLQLEICSIQCYQSTSITRIIVDSLQLQRGIKNTQVGYPTSFWWLKVWRFAFRICSKAKGRETKILPWVFSKSSLF